MERWLAEVSTHYRETSDGLELRYDPLLREAVLDAAGPAPDLWPLFNQLHGIPLALIRGANSDLLTKVCADEMARRRPDMIRVDIPGRGHVPFLDEPESLEALDAWIRMLR
jgi:pimeloyl-ACP methyl ester carboxylesterase